MANPTVVVHVTPSPAGATSHRDALLAMLAGARTSVEFAAYAFTFSPFAAAVLAARDRGVRVWGVCDATQALNAKAQAPVLRAAGVDVRLVGDQYRLMHDKCLLVDGDRPRSARALLGSHNWTGGSGTDNREVSVSLSGSWVSRVFAPVFRAQLDAAYAAGH